MSYPNQPIDPQPQFVQEQLAVGPRREIVVSPMVSFYVLSDEIWFGTCVCVSRDGVEQLNLRFSDPFSRTWAERMRPYCTGGDDDESDYGEWLSMELSQRIHAAIHAEAVKAWDQMLEIAHPQQQGAANPGTPG